MHFFKKPLDIIINSIEEFAQSDPDNILELVIESKLRHQIFKVEGLLRIYRKDNKKALKAYSKVKELEDVLGQYDLYTDLIEFSTKIKVDDKVLKYLEKKKAKIYKKVTKLLLKKWRKPKVSKVLDKISSLDDIDKFKDNDFYQKFFIKTLKKLKKTELDMNEIEDGIHEIRRQIRWILIYIQSLQGRINFFEGLGKSKNSEFNQLSTLEVINANPYSNFHILDEEVNPILISRPYYEAMGYVVGKIGKIKSNGELFYNIAHTYMELGLSSDFESAFEKIVKLGEDSGLEIRNWTKEAKEILDFINYKKENDVFSLMINEFSKSH